MNNGYPILKILFFCVSFFLINLTLTAQAPPNGTITWTGGGGTNKWVEPDNWDLGTAPVAGQQVVIGNGVQVTLFGGNNGTCWGIDLGGTLLVEGELVVNGQGSAPLGIAIEGDGALQIEVGADVIVNEIAGDAIYMIDDAEVANNGNLFITDLTPTGSQIRGIFLDDAGCTLNNDGTLTLDMDNISSDIGIKCEGSLNNFDDGVIDITNVDFWGIENGGTVFANQGEVEITMNSAVTGLICRNSSLLTNTGSIVVDGSGNIGLRVSGQSELRLSTGGSYEISGGTVDDILVDISAFVTGEDNINAGLSLLFGTIAPGNSSGTITFTGDLDLFNSAVYEAELDDFGDHDQIVVTGNLDLAEATLEVSLLNGFSPDPEDQFLLMTYGGTLAETFDNVSLPAGMNDFEVFYDQVGEVWLAGPASDVAAPGCGINTYVGSGNWNVPANWSLGIIPSDCHEVVISGSSVVVIPVGFAAVAYSLTVGPNAELNNAGDLVLDGGGVNFNSSIYDHEGGGTNSGSLIIRNYPSEFGATGFRVENNSTFTNTGSILIENISGVGSGMFIRPDGTFINAGQVIIRDLTNALCECLVNLGEVENSGDLFCLNTEGRGIFNSTASSLFTNTGDIEIENASRSSLLNDGVFTMSTGNFIVTDAGGTRGIYNTEQMTISGGSVTVANPAVDGIVNQGDFVMTNGSITVSDAAEDGFLNQGDFSMSNGSLALTAATDNGLHNFGDFQVTGGTVNITSEDHCILNLRTLNLSASVQLTGIGVPFQTYGLVSGIEFGNTVTDMTFGGDITVANVERGILAFHNCTLTSTADLVFEDMPSPARIGLFTHQDTESTFSGGSITMTDNFAAVIGMSVSGICTSDIDIDITLSPIGIFSTAFGVGDPGDFTNNGTINIQGAGDEGFVNLGTTQHEVGSSVTVGGSYTVPIKSRGEMTGNATLTGAEILNDVGGVLSPGNSAGIFNLTGDLELTQFGSYDWEKTGPAVADRDRVDVTGDVTLDGTLNVAISGFTPATDDAYRLMTYTGALTGTFSTVNLPASISDFVVVYDEPGIVWLAGPDSPVLAPDCGTKVFSGTGSWSDPARWGGGTVPAACHEVIIAGVATIPMGYNAVAINVTVNPGATLDNNGTLTIDGLGTSETGYNNRGDGTNNGTISIANFATLSSTGFYNNLSSDYVNNGTIDIDNIDGTGAGFDNERTAVFENTGTISISNLTDIFCEALRNAGNFTNSGDISIAGTDGRGISNAQSTSDVATFLHSGSIVTENTGSYGIYNDRIFSMTAGNIEILAATTAGIYNVGSSSDFNQTGGTIEMTNSDYCIDNVRGNMSLSGTVELYGDAPAYMGGIRCESDNFNAGSLGIYGDVYIADVNTGLDIEVNTTVDILDAFLTIEDIRPGAGNAGWRNYGTVTASESDLSLNVIEGEFGIENYGTFNNDPGAELYIIMSNSSGSGLYNDASATFDNDERLDISGTGDIGVQNDGDFVHNGSSVRVADNFMTFFQNDGDVSGDGYFDVPEFDNGDGSMSPGNSPGTLAFDGTVTFTANSTYNWEKTGTAPTDSDLIDAQDDIFIDGTLNVTISGFTPQPNDEYVLLESAGDITGTFSTVNLPPALDDFTTYFGMPGRILLVGPASPLPVRWGAFTATATPQQHSLLEWETTAELNNRGFHVQHSTDGRSFQTIGWVAATNDNAGGKYRFTHPSPQLGDNYYRLEQEDYDGTTDYSPIVQLQFGALPATVVEVFPNPVAAQGRLTLTLPVATTEVRLYDARQQLVRRWSAAEPGAVWQIKVPALPAGQYWLRSNDGEAVGVVVF